MEENKVVTIYLQKHEPSLKSHPKNRLEGIKTQHRNCKRQPQSCFVIIRTFNFNFKFALECKQSTALYSCMDYGLSTVPAATCGCVHTVNNYCVHTGLYILSHTLVHAGVALRHCCGICGQIHSKHTGRPPQKKKAQQVLRIKLQNTLLVRALENNIKKRFLV